MEMYIITFKENAGQPGCSGERSFVARSEVPPTPQTLSDNYLLSPGHCSNFGSYDCSDCKGSVISDFKVEEFSPERAKELGLEGKVIDLYI